MSKSKFEGIDTNSLLDRCDCGAYGRFVKRWNGKWVAECTECAETTEPNTSFGMAMIEWNRDRRRGR